MIPAIMIEAGKALGEVAKEAAKTVGEAAKEAGSSAMDLGKIEKGKPESIFPEFFNKKNVLENSDKENLNVENELTDKEKLEIKNATGWSDEIINNIGSMEEFEIYRDAGLKEAEINGEKCLVRDDIDWDRKDSMGRTNKERAEQGLSPINNDGKVIELHHIGQHADSPLAELTPEQHRGKGNDTILHDKTKVSEIDREAFAKERNNYWNTRKDIGDI